MDKTQAELDDATLVYLQLLLDAGCKFLYRTILFEKPYVWMRSAQGNIFLERIPEDPDA